MKSIQIDFIPKDQQRYDTVGDWYYDGDTLHIKASGGEDEAFLISLHELVEAFLCHKHGVTQEQVDQFDFGWFGNGEPGDSSAAPYQKEHRFAMIVEHLIAHELGLTGYGEIK